MGEPSGRKEESGGGPPTRLMSSADAPPMWTRVGSGRGRGVQRPTGRRQLLALTHALVWEPWVLSSDEAPDAVDHASEAQLRTAVRQDRAHSERSDHAGASAIHGAPGRSGARHRGRASFGNRGPSGTPPPSRKLCGSGRDRGSLLGLAFVERINGRGLPIDDYSQPYNRFRY
jgi:hypothetical protein